MAYVTGPAKTPQDFYGPSVVEPEPTKKVEDSKPRKPARKQSKPVHRPKPKKTKLAQKKKKKKPQTKKPRSVRPKKKGRNLTLPWSTNVSS